MELEFKGTKYEWKYLPQESKDRTHTIREIKANGTSICIVRTNNQEQAESNAKLIASAPSLLEALQGLMKEYKSIADSGDCGWWKAEEQEKYIIAQKAIEKAIK